MFHNLNLRLWIFWFIFKPKLNHCGSHVNLLNYFLSTNRASTMTEDAQLKIRLSQELKSILEERSKSNNRTMNGEIVNILEQALLNTKADSGRSIYFNDLNCIEDYPKEPLHERTARVERMISDIFYRNPQYQLINIETLNDGKKIRYWYSIPRSESFRD